MRVVLQMSNLISIHNSKTVLPGASSTQRQNASVFVLVLLLKGEQLEQLIAQMNKLRCFIYLFLLTETDKFSVFLLSEMNNAISFTTMKRTTCAFFFLSKTSDLSGLKAVKPTAFANPNPGHLAHFLSETNMICLKAVKTVIPRGM